MTKALDMTTDISIRLDQLALVVALLLLDLLVREDNVSTECLGHEEEFTKDTRAAPQYLIRVGRDDCT